MNIEQFIHLAADCLVRHYYTNVIEQIAVGLPSLLGKSNEMLEEELTMGLRAVVIGDIVDLRNGAGEKQLLKSGYNITVAQLQRSKDKLREFAEVSFAHETKKPCYVSDPDETFEGFIKILNKSYQEVLVCCK